MRRRRAGRWRRAASRARGRCSARRQAAPPWGIRANAWAWTSARGSGQPPAMRRASPRPTRTPAESGACRAVHATPAAATTASNRSAPKRARRAASIVAPTRLAGATNRPAATRTTSAKGWDQSPSRGRRRGPDIHRVPLPSAAISVYATRSRSGARANHRPGPAGPSTSGRRTAERATRVTAPPSAAEHSTGSGCP